MKFYENDEEFILLGENEFPPEGREIHEIAPSVDKYINYYVDLPSLDIKLYSGGEYEYKWNFKLDFLGFHFKIPFQQLSFAEILLDRLNDWKKGNHRTKILNYLRSLTISSKDSAPSNSQRVLNDQTFHGLQRLIERLESLEGQIQLLTHENQQIKEKVKSVFAGINDLDAIINSESSLSGDS